MFTHKIRQLPKSILVALPHKFTLLEDKLPVNTSTKFINPYLNTAVITVLALQLLLYIYERITTDK